MLGHDLIATAPPTLTVRSAAEVLGRRLDITDRESLIATISRARAECVVNAAAYTRVDDAEKETDRATAVNATAVGVLGQECAEWNIRVVHFSTDYVFPGNGTTPYREGDPTSPVNAYGLSKLRGEQALRASGARALIVRTQWLFGKAGRSFPRTMWERATGKQPTRVVNDQIGRPTYSRDLARWTWQLVDRGVDGIMHVANAGTATWFDVASRVFARAGVGELLTPCTSAEFPTPARRPSYSALDTTRLEREIGPLRPWEDSLDEFLEELGTGKSQ